MVLFTINGKKEYFIGTNSYWIGFLNNNADVDLVMFNLVAVC
jgi:mannan endo-1,4-beta-mannosidase